MTTHLSEIKQHEIKRDFPHLFHKDAQYFSIVKNEDNCGIYGIIDREDNVAETFMTIFKQYRYLILNKGSIDLFMNYPFSHGFKEVWTWTAWKSWIKLLKRFSAEGVEFQSIPPHWDNDLSKTWFRKEI